MTVRVFVMFALLAAIIVPIVLAEIRRARPRNERRTSAPRPPKREAAKPPLRLVVNKNDMDRELAALLAKDSRKPSEPEE